MDDGLYTNRNSRSDFIEDSIIRETQDLTNVYIASAFFTNYELIIKLVEKGCKIKLIVRLGFPTSPNVLLDLINNKSIDIRYYTGRTFHPKLYIFGSSSALVGSANLTRSGVLTNTEIMIRITSDDARLDKLVSLFAEYWEAATVLTMKDVKQYKTIFDKSNSIDTEFQKSESNIITEFGKVEFQNIKRAKKKKSKEDIFINDFSKVYQECVAAIHVIEEIYIKFDKRKFSENVIPLRLEVDSFISFVRTIYAKSDNWNIESVSSKEQLSKIQDHISKWHDTKWKYFEETIVNDNYPIIKSVFRSIESIKSSDDDILFDALCVIHSFHDRLRYYKGGLQSLKKEFFKKNHADKIRESLSYLIYGKDRIEKRIYNLIYTSEFGLQEFGRSNVQELVGWVNNENLPVINARTTKVLKYFGFNVKQL